MGSRHPPQLLGQDDDGGSHMRVLRRGLHRFLGGDPVGDTVTNHFQRGRGCSGASLGLTGGRGRGGPIRLGEGRCLTETTSSTWTTEYLCPPTLSVFRGRLTTSLGFSTGWRFVLIPEIRPG